MRKEILAALVWKENNRASTQELEDRQTTNQEKITPDAVWFGMLKIPVGPRASHCCPIPRDQGGKMAVLWLIRSRCRHGVWFGPIFFKNKMSCYWAIKRLGPNQLRLCTSSRQPTSRPVSLGQTCAQLGFRVPSIPQLCIFFWEFATSSLSTTSSDWFEKFHGITSG